MSIVKQIPDKMTDDDNAPANNETKDEGKGKGTRLKRSMGLWTGISIIIGNIIGGGIFVSPGEVLKTVGSPGGAIMVWAFCGLLCMTGAFCYAELGLTIPTSGGDYIYVMRTFGPLMAFLRLWIAILVIYPVQQAIMAWVFGQYIVYPFFGDCAHDEMPTKLLTAAGISVLTYINCRSTRVGTYTNNVFTMSKVLALCLIILIGFYTMIKGENENLAKEQFWQGTTTETGKYAKAMLYALFGYQGWSYLNFVVDELKDPRENLPRGIIMSLVGCTSIYLLTNLAYFAVLNKNQILRSAAVAIDVADLTLPAWAHWLVPVCVALSCIGGVNGSIIVSSRIFFIGAKEKQMPDLVSMINYDSLTPIPALLCTGGLSIFYVFTGAGMFQLMSYCMFANWIWYAAAVMGLIRWRFKYPDLERPFTVHLGIPIFFVILCLGLLLFSFVQEPKECGIGLVISGFGVPVYYMLIKNQESHPRWLKDIMHDVTRQGQLLFKVVPED